MEIKIMEAARAIEQQIAEEKRLKGPPMELPDGTAITPYNMENETTLNYFKERVSDHTNPNQFLAYIVWLEETYGMTEWRKKVVQADEVTRAFVGALIEEKVMGVVDTAKLAFNFVVDPEKTTQEMVDQAAYLIEHPEVLWEAARTIYKNFDEGTPEQRAAMLGSAASLLVPGVQITKSGKIFKVVDGVLQEVVTQTVDKVKDISKGIQRSDALGNLQPFGSMAIPGGMGGVNVPNDFQSTVHQLDSPEPVFNAKKVDPDNARVDTPEAYLRDYDTEYKILNDIASQLGNNKNAKGTINLFTERLTCQSCADVIMDFRKQYPNITVNILTNDGKIVK